MRLNNLLIITPGTCGGSWDFTYLLSKELVKHIDVNIFTHVLAGKICKSPIISNNTKYHSIKLNFFKLYIASNIHNIIKGIIYGFGTLPYAIFITLYYRPSIIIFNGLAPFLLLSFFIKVFMIKSKIILSYHGTIQYNTKFKKLKSVITSIINNCSNVVIVNSRGVKEELINMGVHNRKVIVVEHIAHDVFLNNNLNCNDAKVALGIPVDSFVFSFVGHLTEEKLFHIYMDVLQNLLKKDNDIYSIIVGTGPLSNMIKSIKSQYRDRIIYLGYVNDLKQLKLAYSASDIIWAYADETYIAKPGIEALACGTPVLIPNVPAIYYKINKNIKIKNNIVPNDIGFLIDIGKTSYVAAFILKLKDTRKIHSLRQKCKKYAIENHSLIMLSNKIKDILNILDLDTNIR